MPLKWAWRAPQAWPVSRDKGLNKGQMSFALYPPLKTAKSPMDCALALECMYE